MAQSSLDVLLPLLAYVADGSEHENHHLLQAIPRQMNLSEKENIGFLEESLGPAYAWARKNGLLVSTRTGHTRITQKGLMLVGTHRQNVLPTRFDRGRSLFTVTINPSFRPKVIMDLERCRKYGRADHTQIAWRREFSDPGQMNSFGESGTVDLPRDIAENLIQIVREARVPVSTTGQIGLDGISYEITFGDIGNYARFAWWQSPPEGWEPLSHVAQALSGQLPFYI